MQLAREEKRIVTSTAALSLEQPGLVVWRWRTDAQYTEGAIQENIEAVGTLCCECGPCCLLIVTPSSMKLAPELMNIDFYRAERGKRNITALAVLADNAETYMASKLYFMYHPQPFEARTFEEESDALAWLQGFFLPAADSA